MGSTASTEEPMREEPLSWRYTDGQKVKSISSVLRISCVFHNHTPYTLNMMWLNYMGDPVSYGLLRSGTTKLMYTYSTHPWVFKAMDEPAASSFIILRGSMQPVLFPSLQQKDYYIETAPSLVWTPALHARHWHKCLNFKAQVQTLLLSQHRLHQQTSCKSSRRSSRSGCSAVFSCLPSDASSPSGCASIKASGTESHCRSPTSNHIASLQDLPADVLLVIIRWLAPRMPDTAPMQPTDMELPPPNLMAEHLVAAAAIQAQMAANAGNAAQIAPDA